MDTPKWYPDELARAGAEHRDPSYVAGYDRKAAVDPAEDLALLRGLGLGARSVVVDLGAGTGAFALAAASHCGQVIAVDVSPAMVAALRAKVERLGLRNITCEQAGFLSYQHRGAPADLVYSRNALHHLPDFWKALAFQRIAAILRPGAALILRDLIFSFEPSEAAQSIDAWLASADQRADDPNPGWSRAELEEHLRDEYSTFTWLLEPMLERAGFQVEERRLSPSGIYTAYLCRKRDRATQPLSQ